MTEVANSLALAVRDRKLCSVVRVKQILPIHGADNINLALINGWQCVIKKNEFQENDLAVYYSIDSIPDYSDPNLSDINARCKGGRIKTAKLRGVISQGLLGPLSWLTSRGYDINNYKEGDDITEEMNVVKYIRSEEADQYCYNSSNNDGNVNKVKAILTLRRDFPIDVPKTDEIRLQENPFLLDYIANRKIVITRKEDGSSGTFVLDNNQFKICSRNYEWLEGDSGNSHYFRINQKYEIEKGLRQLNRNIALQGEVVGPKMNGNRLKLNDHTFRVFNIFDIDQRKYVLWNEVEQICSALKLETVPVIFRGNSSELELTVAAFLNLAESLMYTKNILAEGIVVKTDDDGELIEIAEETLTDIDSNAKADEYYENDYDLFGRVKRRVSFKVISNKYLLKHDS